MTGHQGTPSTWQRSAWRNRIQSILLILFLLGLVALLGELLFGESGRWLALAAGPPRGRPARPLPARKFSNAQH